MGHSGPGCSVDFALGKPSTVSTNESLIPSVNAGIEDDVAAVTLTGQDGPVDNAVARFALGVDPLAVLAQQFHRVLLFAAASAPDQVAHRFFDLLPLVVTVGAKAIAYTCHSWIV